MISFVRPAVAGRNSLQEMSRQQRNILFAFAQRRHEEGNHVQAIEQDLRENCRGRSLLRDPCWWRRSRGHPRCSGSSPPTGVKRCSSSVRSTFDCVFRLMSPTSSRKSVPPSAFWNLPSLLGRGAGECAFACGRTVRSRSGLREWPRNSLRRTVSSLRRLCAWIAARPVPCRCLIRRRSARARWCGAMSAICWRSAFIGTLSPTMTVLDCSCFSRSSFSSRSRRASMAFFTRMRVLSMRERLFEEVVGAEFGGAHGGLNGAVAGDHDDFRAVFASLAGSSPASRDHRCRAARCRAGPGRTGAS